MFDQPNHPAVDRHLLVTQRLRSRRLQLGLTQKQVVTRLARRGVRTTNKTLSSFEHGAGVDVCRLPDLAVALECTVTYLLGLTEQPTRWEPDHNPSLGRSVAGRDAQSADAHLILGPDIPAKQTHR
ncbi:helix-turn-helix domain-containing protein [Kribbella sp. NPDC004875]|uniref:helix-turn-helix domain-containing protein n=1 Tax=Kribbella sp. NPDC004875 TaxID=3364107 RepID=UPI0036AE43E3